MQVTRGRHRARRLPVRPAVRIGAVGAFVVVAAVTAATWPGAAVADAPVQTGWWNAMSGGGESAPSPTTPEGGLRLAVSPGDILAYGAVQYLFPAGSGGTLELKVADSTALPEINPNAPSTDPVMPVVACPTKGSWQSGDNQDLESAPAYDCSSRTFVGSFSADGKTATFLVDDGGQQVPGQLSLAIVPVTTNAAPAGVGTELPIDVTSPMVIDFAKPDAGSLTVTAPFLPPTIDDGTSGGVGPGTSDGSSTGTGQGSSGSGTGGGGYTAPNVPLGGLPGGATTTGNDQPPVVAPNQPAGGGVPVAVAAPAATDDTAHNAALALLLLLGLLIAATNSGHAPRAPRLLGGAGRHAAGAAGATAAGAGATGAGTAAAVAPVTMYGSRGLGRFNKPRSTPPRPLI